MNFCTGKRSSDLEDSVAEQQIKYGGSKGHILITVPAVALRHVLTERTEASNPLALSLSDEGVKFVDEA